MTGSASPGNILSWILSTMLLCACFPATAADITTLKVCADPNYAPFSTRDQKGFENKIAILLADKLGAKLEYTWFPQRMGFIRNTLRAKQDDGETYKCDLVMGVPDKYELAITTDPYYSSTYALVYSDASLLKGITSTRDVIDLAPEKRDRLRIGMTERSPGTLWMAKYNLHEQIVPYVAQSGNPEEFPGEAMLKDLLAGKLDAAVVWGPTAGHFTTYSSDKTKLYMLPLFSEPGVKFDFAISAAVRFGEKSWKNQINQLLVDNAQQIHEILKSYQVPLLDKHGVTLN
jgi:quinoprotein dehydrogenase-associated probable ABC transporter substrate-binding protein